MNLTKIVSDSAIMARMGFKPTVNDVMEQLVMRYHGDDAATLAWLSDIAGATAFLIILDGCLRKNRLDAEHRALHARLQRDLAALTPALTECLGDLDGCVFPAVVDLAGGSWWIVADNAARAGIVGHG